MLVDDEFRLPVADGLFGLNTPMRVVVDEGPNTPLESPPIEKMLFEACELEVPVMASSENVPIGGKALLLRSAAAALAAPTLVPPSPAVLPAPPPPPPVRGRPRFNGFGLKYRSGLRKSLKSNSAAVEKTETKQRSED